jgi:predicted transcriptional regulator
LIGSVNSDETETKETRSRPHKFRNRNRMEIVANLLQIAKSGALKTHLMYRANLSYLMVTEYLQYLTRSQLIEETVDEEGVTKVYRTSPKGLKYLQVYDSLQSIAGLGSSGEEKTNSVLS